MLGLTAEQIGVVLVGISTALIALLGGREGKKLVAQKGGAPAGDVVEVAGALVSDKAAAEWVRSCDDLRRSIDRNTRAMDHATDASRKTVEAMNDLRVELVRNQH